MKQDLQKIEHFLLSNPSTKDINCIPAAVLLPLIQRHGQWHLVFTQRSMEVTTHKGQISFPGGVEENEDKSSLAAALRETHEEIGLEPQSITVLGYLPGLKTVTNFWITPVVGVIARPFPYSIDTVEVTEVFEVPLNSLLDKNNVLQQTREYRGITYNDVRYTIGDKVIWGATGKLIHSLLSPIFSAK